MAVLLTTLALAISAQTASYTADDTLTALETASPRARCIVRAETGGTFNPHAVGRQGELGVAQLHPAGELRTFFRYGYGDPFDPYQAVEFLERRLAEGGARAWSPVLSGMC